MFGTLVLVLLVYILGMDRSLLTDQQNYLDNFSESASLEWLRSVFEDESLLTGLITQVFSEELLWRLWATVVGLLVTPPTAVLVTICVLNLLVVASVSRLPGPVLGLALWIVLPVGLAVTGLIQLRQGFAFAVLLFFAVRLNKPVLGSLLAAMIHTTFALAFVFAVIGWALRSKPLVSVGVSLLVALALSASGALLFALFGGRRLETYSVDEGATSIFYVFGGLLCILPSLFWMLTKSAPERADPNTATLSWLALIHIGSTAFTLFSFFIFPLGAGRVGYLSQLMLIPILPALRPRREGGLALGLFSLLLLYVVYLAGKSYGEGIYDLFFRR